MCDLRLSLKGVTSILKGGNKKMYPCVFIKQENKQLHLVVVGVELDFPRPPVGIFFITVTLLLSTLESSAYQSMVIWSLARNDHPLLSSIKASGMHPYSLSDWFIFWLQSWGAKLASHGEFPCVNVHILHPHPSRVSFNIFWLCFSVHGVNSSQNC